MALIERPLASVIAQPRFTSPRQLVGQTVGVTGDPSDLAVLHSVVAGAGGNPANLKTITIGYDAVPDLISGHDLRATAFWNDEGLQLSHSTRRSMCFKVEDSAHLLPRTCRHGDRGRAEARSRRSHASWCERWSTDTTTY